MVENKNNATNKLSKKKLVLLDIFAHCQEHGNYEFDNHLVKEIIKRHRFGNAYDATKIDNTSILPDHILKQDYCIAHLGEGRHKFVQGVKHFFHNFEEIESATVDWPYRKSALNEIDSSESNILSVGFNQRIIHDFLYQDIVASPKMYGARRTKLTTKYQTGKETLSVRKAQIEIDMTTEYLGAVTVFEGKNKFPENFAVCQLFLPFLYFHQMKQEGTIDIRDINCCYLTRKKVGGESVLRLHLYTFDDPQNLASLKLLKNAEYRLVKR